MNLECGHPNPRSEWEAFNIRTGRGIPFNVITGVVACTLRVTNQERTVRTTERFQNNGSTFGPSPGRPELPRAACISVLRIWFHSHLGRRPCRLLFYIIMVFVSITTVSWLRTTTTYVSVTNIRSFEPYPSRPLCLPTSIPNTVPPFRVS